MVRGKSGQPREGPFYISDKLQKSLEKYSLEVKELVCKYNRNGREEGPKYAQLSCLAVTAKLVTSFVCCGGRVLPFLAK